MYMFMEFLYFPEDKSEYIPAFIMLVIFMVGAIAAMYFILKKSKQEEEYYDEKYNLHTKDVDESIDESKGETIEEISNVNDDEYSK